jgi:hypothetical protein
VLQFLPAAIHPADWLGPPSATEVDQAIPADPEPPSTAHGPGSDVNVLISFNEDAPWSLWDLIAMWGELAELFGRPVDLVETEGLRLICRQQILETRQVIYGSNNG